jgi:hypothetical protein
MNAAKTVATALIAATAITGLTACNPGTEPTGTVTHRTGGAPMAGKGATLTVTGKDGKTAVVSIPAGVYESCHVGMQYPKCK